jgi:hypothetical protein
VSFKQALNDSVRAGAQGGVDYAFRTPAFDIGIRVDLTKANELAADLDDAQLLNKLRAGR